MKQNISPVHKKKLEEIRKELSITSSKEGNFVKVELLFYEAIAVARDCNSNEEENALLAALKEIQVNEYKDTKAFFKKSTQRERVIRRFVSSIKAVLATGIKNGVTMEKQLL